MVRLQLLGKLLSGREACRQCSGRSRIGSGRILPRKGGGWDRWVVTAGGGAERSGHTTNGWIDGRSAGGVGGRAGRGWGRRAMLLLGSDEQSGGAGRKAGTVLTKFIYCKNFWCSPAYAPVQLSVRQWEGGRNAAEQRLCRIRKRCVRCALVMHDARRLLLVQAGQPELKLLGKYGRFLLLRPFRRSTLRRGRL